ncbi:copper resistance protein CopC [Janibacter sp. DB-40]|uniref:copper resistance CopC family protein n=1 Tax=Janibacter sp. DB-40 TaxID=3028808 RepID=UPI00240745D7|nr:copper resistance protein CopC [Janibacter sp. DB-40]
MTTSANPLPPFARALGAMLAAVALMAASVIIASPADAHARLEGSSPQDGATLSAVPPEIMLRFNEPIEAGLNQVSVKSGSTEVAKGDPQVDGSNVYQPIEYTMDPGEYTVTYKVVSADGHPVSGSFTFTYSPADNDGQVDEDTDATPYSPSETSSPAESEETSPTEGSSESPAEETSTPAEESSEEGGSSPSETATATDESPTPEADAGEETAQETTSPWWWALAVGALVVVIGGLVMLVRGRRDHEDEETPRG